ncbi:PREDICTED: rRNA 2'-O-methyltransferase fibrillarin-like [Prunus mume]|uniref:rRNA 2'-O-methyltransferase fibrillarin-like n=1 Tax=Prunus mume TaxID=102107 RepID=A0ABM0NFN6_PRUMU|nr:PREDICTED: rRNA 2'-O-methyltransferase fibrillarin-like [Prunus mume]
MAVVVMTMAMAVAMVVCGGGGGGDGGGGCGNDGNDDGSGGGGDDGANSGGGSGGGGGELGEKESEFVKIEAKLHPYSGKRDGNFSQTHTMTIYYRGSNLRPLICSQDPFSLG